VIILDVNVVVATFRADHPHHGRVRPWLEDVLSGSIPVAVPDVVWVGFVRICTNQRVFTVPSGLDDTLAFVRAFTALPTYVHLGGHRDGVEPFLETASASAASANFTTDAYIASVALVWAAAVATLDRDFRRFDGLRIVEPRISTG
jgi:toxin-antitoxin system PIN domain toxin